MILLSFCECALVKLNCILWSSSSHRFRFIFPLFFFPVSNLWSYSINFPMASVTESICQSVNPPNIGITLGVFLVKTKNTFVPVKCVYSMNTYSRI